MLQAFPRGLLRQEKRTMKNRTFPHCGRRCDGLFIWGCLTPFVPYGSGGERYALD